MEDYLMTYLVTSTLFGSRDTQEFKTIEQAVDYVREFAVAAFESGTAEEFAINFATTTE
jgi:hypothetical protein